MFVLQHAGCQRQPYLQGKAFGNEIFLPDLRPRVAGIRWSLQAGGDRLKRGWQIEVSELFGGVSGQDRNPALLFGAAVRAVLACPVDCVEYRLAAG